MAEENGKDRDSLGRFGKGNKASIGRGPNKISTKVRESLVSFLEGNIDSIQESFDTLKPIEKLQFISSILPYVAPKLSSIESEIDNKVSGSITIEWAEPEANTSKNQGSNGELQSLQSGLPDNS